MKTSLISGLGPGHLENEDLYRSCMDPRENPSNNTYIINGIDYHPENLIYKSNTYEEPVLKKLERKTPELVSCVLKSILDKGNIEYDFIPASDIWADKDCVLKADIVCISTSFMWSEYMLDYTMMWLKKNIQYKYLIVGGQYSTLKKDYLLEKYPEINYLVLGDAEISLAPLIHAITSNNLNSILDIPNLAFVDSNSNKIFTKVDSRNIDTYDRVDFKGEWYKIPYTSMKGCPYSCKFCALRVSTPKWRYLSAERILSDWKYYISTNNVKHIDIMDSTFFIPFSRITRLLDELPALNIIWEANARADTPFTPEIIKKLEDSHCYALYFGFESMSNLVLEYIDKKTTLQDNKKINQLFKDSSVNTMMSFIVGFPGETIDEHKKTRDYLLKEHFGHYNIYLFEFEDKSMPIWKDKDKFNLQIFDEGEFKYDWKHGGESWSHCGMNSNTAKKLRSDTIMQVRCSDSLAIHRTWQYKFYWPFITRLSRQENIYIEKLLDQLVFVSTDYPEHEKEKKILDIIKQLEKYNIFVKRKV